MSNPVDAYLQQEAELIPADRVEHEAGGAMSDNPISFDPDVPLPSGPEDYGFCEPAGAGAGELGDQRGVGDLDTKPANELPATLRPLDLPDFLDLELPPRRTLLRPWLPRKSITMIYGPRGMGKTLLMLSVGYAVASGGELFGWNAPEPHQVLYIDAEMPADEMQRRLAANIAGANHETAPGYFRILSADASDRGLPDLATPAGQRAFDEAIGDAELVIMDNISTLVRSGKENEAESWGSVQEWALKHRRGGKSILFAHHANKSGEQRGTSKREDVMDTVIALRRPDNYNASQGARFVVQYTKARGFFGAEAEAFEARYEEREGAAVWTRSNVVDADLNRVAEAARNGMSVRETAVALSMSKSTVQRVRERAKEQGLLAPLSQCPGA